MLLCPKSKKGCVRFLLISGLHLKMAAKGEILGKLYITRSLLD